MVICFSTLQISKDKGAFSVCMYLCMGIFFFLSWKECGEIGTLNVAWYK